MLHSPPQLETTPVSMLAQAFVNSEAFSTGEPDLSAAETAPRTKIPMPSLFWISEGLVERARPERIPSGSRLGPRPFKLGGRGLLVIRRGLFLC